VEGGSQSRGEEENKDNTQIINEQAFALYLWMHASRADGDRQRHIRIGELFGYGLGAGTYPAKEFPRGMKATEWGLCSQEPKV
jgi:hypothetical protein